mgnify:CR=1 FL=1
MLYGMDLFSGIGGITIALSEFVRPVAYCEIDPYCQSVLLQRMSEGNLPKAPIWDNIRTLSAKELPRIDIIFGGFPCQDISIAGRQKGLEGERSGLVFEILRLIDETKPPFVFLENVPNIRTKGAERVCKELSERGYDCRWCNLSASDVGARHKRERWFLLAHSTSQRCYKRTSKGIQSEGKTGKHEKLGNNGSEISNSQCEGLYEGHEHQTRQTTRYSWVEQANWAALANVCRVVNALPHRVDRIKALGNSVVPLQVKTAFKMLMGIK